MLKEILKVKDEDIKRSEELPQELANPNLPPKRRGELMEAQAALAGMVLRPTILECLNDSNKLDELLKGHLVKKVQVPYLAKMPNLEKIERWGWQAADVAGKKMMFDPHSEEVPPKYVEIPLLEIERYKTNHLVFSNRKQIEKIADLLKSFVERCRGELQRATIPVILTEKAKVEDEIGRVDRGQMEEENFSESEYLDATWIRKGTPAPRVADSEAALLSQFDSVSAAVQSALKK